MNTRRRLLVIALIVLVAVVLLISIPVWLLQRNPPVVQEPPWNSPQTRALAVRACFDCHSNQTNWPIWTRIPPGSWLAMFDTIRGRRHLNFSEYGAARQGGEGEGFGGQERGAGRDEFARVIQDGEMPPWYYLMLHPEAKLSDAEKQQLTQGLEATLGNQ
jgi:hypothetical protein